jgi:DNA-binding transcriptional regulator YiaG
MTGRAIAEIRESMQLSRDRFANLLGVAELTVWRWEKASGRSPTEAHVRLLSLLAEAPAKKQIKVAEALRSSGWRQAWKELLAS